MKKLSRTSKWRRLRHARRAEVRRVKRQASRPSRVAVRQLIWGPSGDDAAFDAEENPNEVTYTWPDQPVSPFLFRGQAATVKCPKIFSLIDNPEQTIQTFDTFVAAARNPTVREITIDQSEVESTDLCASAVLGVLVQTLRKGVDKINHRFPHDGDAKTIAWAAGLPRILGIERPTKESFMFYKLVVGPPKGHRARGSSLKEIEATLIVDYLDGCFAKYQYHLRDETKTHLSNLITEALANSEDHTEHGGWWMAAYLRQGRDYGDVHLTLFNLGRSVADSLTAPTVSERIRSGCAPALEALRKAKSFRRGYTEECFWTLSALQPGVTSKPDDASSDLDRGTGFVRIIEAFSEIGSSSRATDPPVMAVVSGQAFVKLDGTYRLRDYVTQDARTLQRIAFNAENDLRKPPDRRFVWSLKRRFPGTIVSCRFFIDKDHLRSQSKHVSQVS